MNTSGQFDQLSHKTIFFLGTMASLIYSVCARDSPPGVSINHLDPDLEKLLFLGLFYKKKKKIKESMVTVARILRNGLNMSWQSW